MYIVHTYIVIAQNKCISRILNRSFIHVYPKINIPLADILSFFKKLALLKFGLDNVGSYA